MAIRGTRPLSTSVSSTRARSIEWGKWVASHRTELAGWNTAGD
jgi:hypothetical protein